MGIRNTVMKKKKTWFQILVGFNWETYKQIITTEYVKCIVAHD